jgi:hypothetical protein
MKKEIDHKISSGKLKATDGFYVSPKIKGCSYKEVDGSGHIVSQFHPLMFP